MILRFDGLVNVWNEGWEHQADPMHNFFPFVSSFDHCVELIELVGKDGKTICHQKMRNPVQVKTGDAVVYEINVIDGVPSGALHVESDDPKREGSEDESAKDS